VSDYQWEALHIAWEQIDPEMRGDMREPDCDADYQDFLAHLEEANEEWRETLRLKDEKERKKQKGVKGAKPATKATKGKKGKR
jgi:hypothetical protein